MLFSSLYKELLVTVKIITFILIPIIDIEREFNLFCDIIHLILYNCILRQIGGQWNIQKHIWGGELATLMFVFKYLEVQAENSEA